MDKWAVKLEQVSYRYEPQGPWAIKEVSLSVKFGDWIAVVGPSGSGKSTLAQLLSGHLPRALGGEREGEIFVDGIDPASSTIAEIVRRIGVVWQDPDAQLVQGRLEDEVAFGPENMCCERNDIDRRVSSALEAVNLNSRRREKVHSLSGGQRQRAAIAAVLALETPLLVLDEPLANLDAGSRQAMLELLKSLSVEGRTLITVSGRIDGLAAAAKRLIVMDRGTIVMDDSPSALIQNRRQEFIKLGLLSPFAWETKARYEQKEGLEQAVTDVHKQSTTVIPLAATSFQAEEAATIMPLVTIRDLSYTYRGQSLPVLDKLSLLLRPGEWYLLCGENGSGKTTLSQLICGLLRPPRNTIWWMEQDVAKLKLYELAAHIGFVFQQPEHQFVAVTVLEELYYGVRYGNGQILGGSNSGWAVEKEISDEVNKRAEELLALTGLSARKNDSPYVLSGGEKRLLSAAAMMMSQRKLYILDEPTAGTDYAGAAAVTSLCRFAVSKGASVLIVTHEPECFINEGATLLRLRKGRLIEYQS